MKVGWECDYNGTDIDDAYIAAYKNVLAEIDAASEQAERGAEK